MRLSISDSAKRGQEKAIVNMQAVSQNKIADSYLKVACEENLSMHEKGVVAGLLNNFAKVMDAAPAQSFTKSSDFGPYVMEVWPLVTAWYPDFPLKDLISVQDMDKPLAYMFFSMLKAGTTKAGTTIGDVVETPLGMRTIKGQYPTGEVVGEEILNGQIDGTSGTILAYYPLNVATIPGYLDKTLVVIAAGQSNAGTYHARTVESGKILFADASNNDVTSTNLNIDVATGVLAGAYVTGLASAQGTTKVLTVNYVWNLDFATTENIQRVKEEVELRPMEAIPRALMLEWTLFSEYLKKTQFGQDIREDNTKRILNLMYQYQVRYILDEMYDYATGDSGNTTTVALALSTQVSLEVQAANVLKQLNVAANKIEIASGRMAGNRIVCGFNFKSFLEAMPSNIFTPTNNDASAFSGPREIGTFGAFKVYYDPFRAATEAFMTYRGNEWYDATYYLGEYMPIVPTDAIALGVTVRSSFVSMEAYRYDKPTCTIKLNFTI